MAMVTPAPLAAPAGGSAGDNGGGLSSWVGAAIALGVAIAVATAARWNIRRVGRRADVTNTAASVLARLVFALIVAVGVYVALRAIGLDLGPVLAGAGIAGVAIAFALQRVLLPNSDVLASPMTNLTVNGHRRTDFTIGVAYGTDLDRARQLAIATVDALDEVDSDPPVRTWVDDLAASWINIRIRYWHAPRIADMWRIRSAAIVAVVGALEQAGVELPFERRVIEIAAGAAGPPASPLGTD